MDVKRKFRSGYGIGAVLALSALLTACPSEPAPSGDQPMPPDTGAQPPPQGEAPADAASGSAAQGAPAAGEAPAGGGAAGGEVAPGTAPTTAGGPGAASAGPTTAGAPGAAGAPQASSGKPTGPDRFNLILPETIPVPTQDKLKKTGTTVTLKGMLTGDECKGKTLRVDAFSSDPRSSGLVTFLMLKDIGHFEMVLPKGDKPVYMLANCDIDGDGFIEKGKDFTGAFTGNPVTPSQDIAGVVITLSARGIPAGAIPQAKPPAPPPSDGSLTPVAPAAPSNKDAAKAGAGAPPPAAPAGAGAARDAQK